MNICVFCSMNDVAEAHAQPAREFAALLVGQRHSLVWGGSNKGLMKLMADEVQNAGGKIIGISAELLKDQVRANAGEMVITKDIAERKALMLRRSDAFVILVGGVGTLDEFTEILELKKHKLHEKPIVILNTDAFYDGLKTQFARMEREHLTKPPVSEFVYFARKPEDAMRYIESYGN